MSGTQVNPLYHPTQTSQVRGKATEGRQGTAAHTGNKHKGFELVVFWVVWLNFEYVVFMFSLRNTHFIKTNKCKKPYKTSVF